MTIPRVLFVYPLRGLGARRAAWLPIFGWLTVMTVLAAQARGAGIRALDGVVTGPFGGFLLPFFVLTVVTALLDRRSLGTALAPLVAFGASRRDAARAFIATLVATSAAAGAALGLAVILAGRSGPVGATLVDAATTAFVGALGGAAYGALFALASTFGPAGAGRLGVLFVDWMLGNTSSLAFVLPRAHVNNLLGAAVRIDVPPRASTLLLVALTAVFASSAVRRATK